MGANISDYSVQKEPEIDADMTPRHVIETLKRLRFKDGSCAISIDKQIRDYLVTTVSVLRVMIWHNTSAPSAPSSACGGPLFGSSYRNRE